MSSNIYGLNNTTVSSNVFGFNTTSFYSLLKRISTSYVTIDTEQTITADKVFANLDAQNILGQDISAQGNIIAQGDITAQRDIKAQRNMYIYGGMPSSSNSSTLVPTTAWVQSAISAYANADTIFNGVYIGGSITVFTAQSVCIGNDVNYISQTGYRNTHLGYRAGRNVSTGSDNVFIGSSAGLSYTTGSQNVFIGSSAGGSNNSTGINNINVGYESGLFATSGTSNNILIGNNQYGYANNSNTILIGNNNHTQYIQGQFNHRSYTITNTFFGNGMTFYYIIPEVLPNIIYVENASISFGIQMVIQLPVMNVKYAGVEIKIRKKSMPGTGSVEIVVELVNQASLLFYASSNTTTNWQLGSNFYAGIMCDGQYWYLNERAG